MKDRPFIKLLRATSAGALALALSACGKTMVTEGGPFVQVPEPTPQVDADPRIDSPSYLDFNKEGTLTTKNMGTLGNPADSFISAPYPFPIGDGDTNPNPLRKMLRFGWQPKAPYGKELPDGSAAEQGYAEGNINMASNEVLVHFNESAAPFFDSSGKDHHPSCGGNRCPTVTAGKFRNAVQFKAGTYLEMSNSKDLRAGSALSIAVWAKADKIGAYSALFRKDNTGRGLGIYYTGTQLCAYSGRYAADRACALFPQTTDWNHIAMVFEGRNVKLFVNGRLMAEKTVSNQTSDNNYPLRIGAWNNRGGYPWVGSIDELAVFSRALSATELRDMYRRGAYGVKFQLRACAADGTCSPFRGIENQDITELHNRAPRGVNPRSTPEIKVDDLGLVGVTFQFRVSLTAPESEEGPELTGVFARGISVP